MTSKWLRVKKSVVFPFEVLEARKGDHGVDVKVRLPMGDNVHIKGKVTGGWMSMRGRFYWRGGARYTIRSFKNFNFDKLVGSKVRVKELEAKHREEMAVQRTNIYKGKK